MSWRRGTETLLVGDPSIPALTATPSEALESLLQLNERSLELLAEQSATQPAGVSLLSRQVGEIWSTLDAAARRRAASCPYLLVDVGLSDPARWRWLNGKHISDNAGTYNPPFFTVPRAPSIAREVFIYAWHLAHSRHIGAQLLLGMPAHCAQLIAACTLSQVHELAQKHPEWLRPRWPSRLRFWRELLQAAASGEVIALENSRMHGVQLIAAECRKSMQQIPLSLA